MGRLHTNSCALREWANLNKWRVCKKAHERANVDAGRALCLFAKRVAAKYYIYLLSVNTRAHLHVMLMSNLRCTHCAGSFTHWPNKCSLCLNTIFIAAAMRKTRRAVRPRGKSRCWNQSLCIYPRRPNTWVAECALCVPPVAIGHSSGPARRQVFN